MGRDVPKSGSRWPERKHGTCRPGRDVLARDCYARSVPEPCTALPVFCYRIFLSGSGKYKYHAPFLYRINNLRRNCYDQSDHLKAFCLLQKTFLNFFPIYYQRKADNVHRMSEQFSLYPLCIMIWLQPWPVSDSLLTIQQYILTVDSKPYSRTSKNLKLGKRIGKCISAQVNVKSFTSRVKKSNKAPYILHGQDLQEVDRAKYLGLDIGWGYTHDHRADKNPYA